MKYLSNFLLRRVFNSLAVVIVSLGVLSSFPAHAGDSCQWAFDGMCDVPLGNCNPGTDDTDCGIANAPPGPNSCQFALDGDCDEPGLCNLGTDTRDCSRATPASGPNSCQFAFDGVCDQPNNCNNGTDTSDCTAPAPAPTAGPNSCQFAFDGDCDEPGLCNFGTDTRDCSRATPASGPNSCQFAFDRMCDEPLNCNNGTDTSDCSIASAPTPVTPSRPTAVTPSRPITTRPPGLQSTQQGTDIQNALNYFGFDAGRVDGKIGAGTRAAIERFQRATGYPANGRNLTPDQFGFLTGAYSWATGPLGVAQGAADGTTKLRNYRTFLINGSVVPTPVVPTPTPVAPVAEAPATPPPPPLNPVWWIAINGATSGPFGLELMRQKVAQGILKRDTMVWPEGQQGAWMQANSIPELTQLFRFLPPPPPPAN